MHSKSGKTSFMEEKYQEILQEMSPKYDSNYKIVIKQHLLIFLPLLSMV